MSISLDLSKYDSMSFSVGFLGDKRFHLWTDLIPKNPDRNGNFNTTKLWTIDGVTMIKGRNLHISKQVEMLQDLRSNGRLLE